MGNEASCVALGLKVWKGQIERADKLFGASHPTTFCGK